MIKKMIKKTMNINEYITDVNFIRYYFFINIYIYTHICEEILFCVCAKNGDAFRVKITFMTDKLSACYI